VQPGGSDWSWILHVTAWGTGEQAVLDYLARYELSAIYKVRAECGLLSIKSVFNSKTRAGDRVATAAFQI
jgi:hypothetical protein